MRRTRFLHAAILLSAAWCVMTFTHELGHVLCGWLSGGRLQRADLLPWHLPYSIFEPDPIPLVTLWGGPILGVLIPLVVAIAVRRRWVWGIAHFCVLANGSYLATAWLTGDHYLDTARLLQKGAHPLSIALYCTVTIGFGYRGFRNYCIELLSPEATDNSVTIAEQKADER
jgi:hypothetical protein